jgi:hypothetical protein
MATWLERYQAGEHEAVWAEMGTLGETIRPHHALPPRPGQLTLPLALDEREQTCSPFTEAISVSRETMQRARINIERLVARLHMLGYVFEVPEWTLTSPPSDIASDLDRLERVIGPLPLSLRCWYETVGTVCLRGEHPKLTRFMWDWAYQHCIFPDPLEFVSPPDYVLAQYEKWSKCPSDERSEKFTMEFSADDYHKAGISGGPAYSITLPNAAADGFILDLWWETTFVSYLRQAFLWGGFPGFARYPDFPREEIGFLTEGLLPL